MIFCAIRKLQDMMRCHSIKKLNAYMSDLMLFRARVSLILQALSLI